MATPRMSVTVRLEGDLEISPGDMLALANGAPEVLSELESTLCWFGPRGWWLASDPHQAPTTRLRTGTGSGCRVPS